ncbi:MAG TPA: glycosyltransferase [Patescibacteria group bacterium]|nr:glycosyltransferase [Patescibacteria group bacterium]
MKIGIDISQTVYEGTGVAEYTLRLVESLLRYDTRNEYVLFFAHHKIEFRTSNFERRFKLQTSNFKLQSFRIPPFILEFLWNRLHIFPIEWFIGNVDVFFTSDWLEPPAIHAKKVTTIHDLSILKVPGTFDRKIINVHKRKLQWVKKESAAILCDSEATKRDAVALLDIEPERLRVVYPGI